MAEESDNMKRGDAPDVQNFLARLGQLEANYESLDKQLKEFMARPFERVLGDFGEQLDTDITERLIHSPGIAHTIDGVIEREAPNAIRNRGPRIEQLVGEAVEEKAKEKLNNLVPEIVNKEVERVTPNIKQQVVNYISNILGTAEATAEGLIKIITGRTLRQKIAAWALALVGFSAIGISSFTLYKSGKEKAESAEGIAERALNVSEQTHRDLLDFKIDSRSWREKHDKEFAQDKVERERRFGNLEVKIGEKSDRVELNAKLSDIDKVLAELRRDYSNLNSLLSAEIVRGSERDKTYDARDKVVENYKGLVDDSRKKLDELGGFLRQLANNSATREYTDSELSKIRENLGSLGKDLMQYAGTISSLQEGGRVGAENYSRLQELYEKARKDYEALQARVEALEKKSDKKEEKQ